jgi:hypothetical protein
MNYVTYPGELAYALMVINAYKGYGITTEPPLGLPFTRLLNK